MTNLREKIRSFQCEEEAEFPTSILKKQKVEKPKKHKSQKISTSTDKYVELDDLPSSIPKDGIIIFVGYNPGMKSSLDQHHYAHPTNLFWKLLNALALFDIVLQKRETTIKDQIFIDLGGKVRNTKNENTEDSLGTTEYQLKPCHDYLLANYGIGFTDLCLRCTKQANELNMAEKLANVPRLFTEFALSKAPYIVIVGKGIWEVIVKYIDAKYQLRSEFNWGKQNQNHILRAVHAACGYKPSIYVFPSTSGLVALMKYPEKLQLWSCLVNDMSSEIPTGREKLT